MTPRTILIVEDSLPLHRLYEIVLRNYFGGEIQVLYATNGREALDLLRFNPDCDLILLDILMPVMGGLQFLREIRKESAFPEIPVIIISTEGQEEELLRGLEAGATAYIFKPFLPRDLHDLLGWIFKGKGKEKKDEGSDSEVPRGGYNGELWTGGLGKVPGRVGTESGHPLSSRGRH